MGLVGKHGYGLTLCKINEGPTWASAAANGTRPRIIALKMVDIDDIDIDATISYLQTPYLHLSPPPPPPTSSRFARKGNQDYEERQF